MYTANTDTIGASNTHTSIACYWHTLAGLLVYTGKLPETALSQYKMVLVYLIMCHLP